MKKFMLLTMVVAVAWSASPDAAEAGHRRPFYPPPFGFWGPSHVYVEGAPNRAYVDCDISPEDARVFVNGREIGEADDFDGFPRHLTLRPGRYRLEFRHPGYRTLVVEVDLRRGWLFRLDDDLQRGDPEDAVARRSGPPPGYREDVERDRQYRDEDRYERDRNDRYDDDYDEDWGHDDRYDDEDSYDDDYGDDDRGRDDTYERSSMRPRAEAQLGYEMPAATGRVRFRVEPIDAAVYVDGEYRGSARDIRASGGLELAEGDHTVVLVRDGYADRTVDISVRGGTRSEVNVRMERMS